MTTDAKHIPPALSAEEWAEGTARHGEPLLAYVAMEGQRLSVYDQGDEADVAPELRPAAIALANAALPDDSPYKITRADVEALLARPHPEADMYHAGQLCCDVALRNERLSALAAKLEALLPPAQ
jgi:hypothetical protein